MTSCTIRRRQRTAPAPAAHGSRRPRRPQHGDREEAARLQRFAQKALSAERHGRYHRRVIGTVVGLEVEWFWRLHRQWQASARGREKGRKAGVGGQRAAERRAWERDRGMAPLFHHGHRPSPSPRGALHQSFPRQARAPLRARHTAALHPRTSTHENYHGTCIEAEDHCGCQLEAHGAG